MTTFVLATANPDKAREIVAVLTDEAPSVAREMRKSHGPTIASRLAHELDAAARRKRR